MEDWAKTKTQLIEELSMMRLQVAACEAMGGNCRPQPTVPDKENEDELRQQTAQLEALHRISLALTAELDLTALLNLIASQAAELLKGTAGGLYLYRPEQDALELVVDAFNALNTPGIILRRGEGLSGKVWVTGQPLMVDNYAQWDGRAAIFEGKSLGAILAVPIVFGREFLGVLNLLAKPSYHFTPADIELLSMFATQAAIAIHNAQLVRSLQISEEEYRLSQQRYELASKVGQVGVWDWDVKTEAGYFSPNLKAMLGYEEYEFSVGTETWLNLVHPDDQPTVREKITAHLNHLTPHFEVEHRIAHKDGRLRWMLVRGKASWDEQGQLRRVMGANTDITELKRAEEELYYRIGAEVLLTSISTNFINLPVAKTDAEINWTLNLVGKFLQADGSYLIMPDADKTHWAIRYKWCTKNDCCVLNESDETLSQIFAWSYEQLCRYQYLQISSLTDLSPEAQSEKIFLQAQGIQSLLVIPFFLEQGLFGLIGLITLSQEQKWSGDQIAFLRLVGEVLVNALQRRQTEEQLQTTLQEKEILLKEIHHRVKNNLQVITSLLDLQAQQLQDDQALAAFTDSRNRIAAMAIVHEHLYHFKNLARVNLIEYLGHLVEDLLQSYGPWRGTITAEINHLKLLAGADLSTYQTIWLGLDKAVPCGLIVNELVSNTLKYAFPHGQTGQITLNLWAEDSHLILQVSDNGIGLPKEVNFYQAESLGLQLVNLLVRQLKGTVEMSRTDGTTVKIVFSP